MLGINGSEFLVLAVLAVLLLGPERIPEYTQKLGEWTRSLKRLASGARSTLREELGDEFDDVDWRKLDPRQYDPRRIVREALLADDEPTPTPPSSDAAMEMSMPTIATQPRLAPGEAAPWDSDAT